MSRATGATTSGAVGPAGTDGGPMVEAVGVRKSFGHHEVLKGISLEVSRGEVMCLLGPSG
jgi:polar amino acid transport system ATP-binding protein